MTAASDQRRPSERRDRPAPRAPTSRQTSQTISAVTGRISRLVPVAPAARQAPASSTSHSQLCATNGSPAVSQLNGSVGGIVPVVAIDSPMAMCHQASGSTWGRHVATHAAASTTAASEPPIGPVVAQQPRGRRPAHRTDGRSPDRAPDAACQTAPMHRYLAVLGIFILSGAAGLIYEIVWSRQLVLVFGNTTQAVSAILTGFFGGMAIGATVGGRIADRVRSPLRLYGLLEIALVVVVLVTPLTFGLINEVYRGIYPALEGTPFLALARLVLAVLALAPATIMMGATFPALVRHFARSAALSQAFGRLYFGQHDGRRRRDAPGRPRPDRAVRAERRAARSGRSARRSPGSSRSGWPGPTARSPTPSRRAERRRAGAPSAARRRATAAASGPSRIVWLPLVDRVRLRPDLARLPGHLDPPARLRHRRH